MSQVITFEGYRPAPRYDALAWAEARIEESDAEDGTYTEVETITLSPVDADPTDPATRNFTTELASDDPDLWYRIVFIDATGDESLPTAAIQNTTSATFTATPYATVAELARLLKVDAGTYDTQLTEVLMAAAGEIDAELGRDTSLSEEWQLALAAQVNLERAEEHWKQRHISFSILGLDAEGAIRLPTDTWRRHAEKLSFLKQSWGLA